MKDKFPNSDLPPELISLNFPRAEKKGLQTRSSHKDCDKVVTKLSQICKKVVIKLLQNFRKDS